MTLTVPISEGLTYYVRVLPATTTYTETGTTTWSITDRGTLLMIEVLGAVDSTPSWLRVNVSNGPPLAPADFWVDGSEVLIDTILDEDGQVLGMDVPLPVMSAGTHILTVATPTVSTTAEFVITNAPASYPEATLADLAPAAIVQTGVVKWVVQVPPVVVDGDILVGGTNYVFPINPSKMTAPYAARVFTSEHSTAADGQPLTFEGAAVGVDWTIEGTCLTQAFHEALDAHLASSRRLFLHDHLGRAWTVTLESINWTRLPAAYNDWAYTYQLKAIILAGPVIP